MAVSCARGLLVRHPLSSPFCRHRTFRCDTCAELQGLCRCGQEPTVSRCGSHRVCDVVWCRSGIRHLGYLRQRRAPRGDRRPIRVQYVFDARRALFCSTPVPTQYVDGGGLLSVPLQPYHRSVVYPLHRRLDSGLGCGPIQGVGFGAQSRDGWKYQPVGRNRDRRSDCSDVYDVRRHVLCGDSRFRSDLRDHGRTFVYCVNRRRSSGRRACRHQPCGRGRQTGLVPTGHNDRLGSIRRRLDDHDAGFYPTTRCVPADHVGKGRAYSCTGLAAGGSALFRLLFCADVSCLRRNVD